MRRPYEFILGAATAAIAASAVFAVVPSLGGSGSDRTPIITHHHGLVGRSVTAAATAGGGIRKIRNLEYKGTAPPGKEDGYHFKCPRATPHAVSGYFVPEKVEQAGQVQLADSFPNGKGNKNWDVGVFNPTTVPQNYFVGVVCVR